MLWLVLVPGWSGCFSTDVEGHVGIRVENRSEGAVGLHVSFGPNNGLPEYATSLVARRGEVGTHITPLGPGNYTVEVVLTHGPAENARADVNDLPPAETHSSLEAVMDTGPCPGLALVRVVVLGGGVLGSEPMTCTS